MQLHCCSKAHPFEALLLLLLLLVVVVVVVVVQDFLCIYNKA